MRKGTRLGLAVAAALALASCSGEGEGNGGSALYGSAEFVRLVEDARFAMNQGDLAEAGRLLDQAREVEPENPGLWVDVARLRFRGGEHLTALEAADYALELGPQYAPALLMRAQLVRDAHGLSDALPWFEAAAQADPGNPELLADYAATLGDAGRYTDMLTVVREIAEIDPKYPQVFYLQAVLAARAGEAVLARSLLTRSGMIERGVPAAMLLNAVIDMQQSTPDNAIVTLERLAERQPGNTRVLELLATALWRSERDNEIVERFGELANAANASPYLAALVGRAHERLGDYSAAAPYLERAQDIRAVQWAVQSSALADRSALPAPTAQMRRLIAAQDTAEAARAASELLSRFPLSSDVHALAGDAAFAGGNAELALERYGIAATIRRPWPLTRKIVAAYREYGDNSAADTLLVRHLRGEPNNSEALLMLAERRALDEDWLRVAVLLDHAIALGAGNDAKLLELRTQAAEALGREQESEQFAQRVAAIRPGAFVGN
ncbi:MAG: tetratricopeptide repeat protein [Pseudomonadota bacterium]